MRGGVEEDSIRACCEPAFHRLQRTDQAGLVAVTPAARRFLGVRLKVLRRQGLDFRTGVHDRPRADERQVKEQTPQPHDPAHRTDGMLHVALGSLRKGARPEGTPLRNHSNSGYGNRQ